MAPADPDHLQAIKARLADVANIDQLSVAMVGGRMVFGINGRQIGFDPFSGDDEIETAIRLALSAPAAPAAAPVQIETPMPVAAAATPKAASMTTAPAPGSFAASLKAMIDEAHAGVEQARADGRARVGAAITKLNDVKASTTKVATGMAVQIEDAARDALADLGQISNDL